MPVPVLNLHGLKCPLPVLKTRKALAAMMEDDIITVECTDALAAIDIPAFIQQSGHVLEDLEHLAGGVLAFRIRRGASS